jgi:hypothetical protein
MVRDTYPKKNWTALPVAGTVGKTINVITTTGVTQGPIKYQFAPTIPAVVSYPDNTDIAVAMYEGLTNSSRIIIKFTVIYEMLLKGNSPLLKQAVTRPPANFRLLEQLRAYESVRCKEANNGILKAEANFWSEIWDGFKNYALPVVGKVASTIFPEAKPLIKGITSAVTGGSGEKVQKDGSIKKPAPKLVIARPSASASVLMKRPTTGSKSSLSK